jgi:hypothetical protein
MTLDVVTEGGVTFVEGSPSVPAASGADVVTAIIEASFGTRAEGAVVYAEQLPPAFFDLSSGVAGEALQRLRNYGVRLAVVVPPGWDGGSSRFGEMVAEERRGRDFGLFESRAAAVRWLTE